MKINQRKSPNIYKGRRGHKPDMIVSHITEGSYAGAVSWLCNPVSKASSHFVVSRKGEITQLVSLEDSSWCNGTSVTSSSKIHYSKSSLPKVRNRKTNANYFTISIEHEGFSHESNGRLSPEQFEATVWLHKWIIAEVKRIYGIDIPVNREHLVGHYQVNPITKPFCPGKNFQWDELIRLLSKGGVSMTTKPWQVRLGEEALDNLSKKRDKNGEFLINNPATWKKSLSDPTPQWLFFELLNRITNN